MLPADRVLLERIGKRIRELREGAKLSQDALGERAGFGGKYIGEIEKGLRDVPLSTLRAIVESGLGLELESVLAGRHRVLPASTASQPRDVELTAELIAGMPMRVRRPLLALVRAVGESEHEVPLASRAAESTVAQRPRKKS